MADEPDINQDFEFEVSAPPAITVESTYVLSIGSNITFPQGLRSTVSVDVFSTTVTTSTGALVYAGTSSITMSSPSPSITHGRVFTRLERATDTFTKTIEPRLTQEKRHDNLDLQEHTYLISDLVNVSFRDLALSENQKQDWNRVVTANASNPLVTRQYLRHYSNNYSLFSRGINAK